MKQTATDDKDDAMIDALESMMRYQRKTYQRYATSQTAMILGAVYMVGGFLMQNVPLQIVALLMMVYGLYLMYVR